MRDILLMAADYRWLAALPTSESEFIFDLIRRLDARFTDSHGSLNASFAAKLECRHVTPEPW